MNNDKYIISMFGQKRLSREGGIEIVVKELCTRMVKNGYTVTCYNRSGHHVSGAEYDKKTEYEGIKQKYVPTIEKKGLAAVSSSFFAALYSAFGKYNVVHIHAEGPAFFSWLPKLLGKRVVVTVHGLDWQREKWKSGFGSKFIKQGEKNAVKYADEIIVLSKGVPFRIIYSREARKKIRAVLDDFQPDVVHLNNIQYHLTPSIILETNKWRKETKKECKIIYTTHDYQLVCPSHGMFDVNMKPCERCLDGHYIHCLQTKCLKNSRAKSLLGTLDGYMWKYSKAYSYVDAYICCSSFLKSKLDTQKRFRDKTIGLHNFKKEMPHLDNIQKKGYVLEFGHLSRDKGTDTLLEVAKKMPNTEFVFIGYGPSVDKMKEIANVKYLGFKTGEELYRLIAEAAISVCPSEMYENCPYSVMESVLLGTPVAGAMMGGIPELIEPGKTGELFEAGNVNELRRAIEKIICTPGTLEKYTNSCKQAKYETTESYYVKLMKIYKGEKNEG